MKRSPRRAIVHNCSGEGLAMDDTLFSLLPLVICGLIVGGLMAVAASKVGRSPVFWFVLGAIPLVNFIFVWIAAWSELIEVHRKLQALERLVPRASTAR